MRALALVGVGALVATMGACVALSGISDYAACSDTCGDGDGAPPVEDVSIRDVRMPTKDATMTPEVRPPPEDTSNPEVREAGVDDAGPSEAAAPMDSGPEVLPPPSDAGPDVVVGPPDAGLGAHCGDSGTTTRCTGSQVCCANLTTERNACASSCVATATIGCSIPSDCPAGTTCCGHMQLTGALPPCALTSFSTACAATCTESPPTSCASAGVVRMCVHDSDCMSDTANPVCFNFNGAPTSWCETAAAGAAGLGVEQH
jgi:hypothetical protein